MESDHAPLLPLNRMARRLRVTIAWLRAEADAGRIPCLRAESRYLFSPETVERVLAERAAHEGMELDIEPTDAVFTDDAIDSLARLLIDSALQDTRA